MSNIPNPAQPSFLCAPTIARDSEVTALNNATYNYYYFFLRNIAMSIYEWLGLPESMNERFLELVLYENGTACIVNDFNLGIINTRCMKSADINIYQECTNYTAFSINYNKTYPRSELALIRNNYMEIPTDNLVQLYARKLYELDRTIDTNIINQKTPLLIECDTNTRQTLINMYNKVRRNEPVIYGHKDYDINNKISVLNTKVDYNGDKLTATKLDIYSEFLTCLGINNANQQKKERLIIDEVNANNDFISLAGDVALLCRKQGCKEANEKFGLNISVRRRNYDELLGSQEETEEREAGEE